MPMPARNATVKFAMPAISAAASARSNRPGGKASLSAVACPGASRIAVIADNSPAIIHAIVDIRRTRTPDSRAESAFSDIARIASP